MQNTNVPEGADMNPHYHASEHNLPPVKIPGVTLGGLPAVMLESITTLQEDSSRIARALFPLGPMMAEDICFVTMQRMMYWPASGPAKSASTLPDAGKGNKKGHPSLAKGAPSQVYNIV